MILQEYIEELGSAVLIIKNSKVSLTGFTCPERLQDYYDKDIKCHFSQGIFDMEDLDFSRIKDDALFIINDKDNDKQYKYHFEVLQKEKLKYKKDKKPMQKVHKIRKCKYTNKYSYIDIDFKILFDTKEDLLKYFHDRFNTTPVKDVFEV